MCWTNDGAQLNRDMPEIKFVLGTDGGEIWSRLSTPSPRSAPNKPAAYALLELSHDAAEVAVKEHVFNGAPTTDSRVMALLPKDVITPTSSSIPTKPR
jgi:spermidine/putrescine transport system substrate-binding protein